MKPKIHALFFALCLVSAQVWSADQQVDRAAIESAVVSYTAAFNQRDAKALAQHWGPNAIYINPVTGVEVEGREAIEQEFESILKGLGEAKFAVEVESIDFLSPLVAVERGIATITTEAGTEVSQYSAVHVKQDGKWLLDRVTEEEQIARPSNRDKLDDLSWMIGTWLDESEEATIETRCQWTRNENFILRTFKISSSDQIDMAGIQIIGWDPVQNSIRSWAFDSDGGFAEGTWNKNENRWVVESKVTFPDGRQGSSINIMTVTDKNMFGWKSIGREVDGSILPNIDEITVKRVAD